MTLKKPILYLERQDFTSNGNLIPSLTAKPVFIMIQADFCGHCHTAKPEFQKVANRLSDKISFMTIQGDGKNPSEMGLKDLLPKICPGFRGYPSYVLIVGNKHVPYSGGRNAEAITDFLNQRV